MSPTMMQQNNRTGVNNLTIDPQAHHISPSTIQNTTSPINAQNLSTRYRESNHAFNTQAMQGMHPASTKNQNTRQFNLKRSLAGGAGQNQKSHQQPTHIHNVQNISNYHFELPSHVILNENDVRSLDRIIDQNGQESSLILPKRPAYAPNDTQQIKGNTKRVRSPKNSQGQN